jgi:hypothetical protein
MANSSASQTDSSNPSQEPSLGELFLRFEPQPLRFPEPPSPLEAATDAARRSVEDLSEAASNAAANLDPIAVTERGLDALHHLGEHAVTHPMTTLHHMATAAKVAMAVGSGGGAAAMRLLSDHAPEISTHALGAAVLDNELHDPPTVAEADARGYLREGTTFYSKDGGLTWRLLAKTPVVALVSVPFGLLAILLAAFAIILAGLQEACSLDLPPRETTERFPAPTLPSWLAPVSPSVNPSVRDSPHEGPGGRPDPADPVPSVSSPTPLAEDYVDWEEDLQAQRVRAAQRGEMSEYNALVEKHRRIYAERNVDPCTSGRFPQGC